MCKRHSWNKAEDQNVDHVGDHKDELASRLGDLRYSLTHEAGVPVHMLRHFWSIILIE